MNCHPGVRYLLRVLPTVALSTAALLLFALPVQAQDLPVEKVLPADLAQEAAAASVAACAERGYRVSAAVVDRGGALRVLLRGDGAGPHTVGSSQGKAFSAASLRVATSELAGRIGENPSLQGLRDMDERILILGGGLPMKAGEDVVAGIGVGGAPSGDEDAACAQAGIDAIQDRLR